MKQVNILGKNLMFFDTIEEIYLRISKQAKSVDSNYITVNNVHTIVESILNTYYNKALLNSAIMLNDSQALNIISKLKGNKKSTRIFGATLMQAVLEYGQQDELVHFFIGSSEETINKLYSNSIKLYPKLKVSGCIAPPFRKLSDDENKLYLEEINRSNPDIVWVGLGAPKQEIWMYENYRKLNSGVMIGIGAGFDYLAGNSRHAPKWMKNMALEWLFRLYQEPARLWKRYLVSNSLFLIFIFLELFRIKKFN